MAAHVTARVSAPSTDASALVRSSLLIIALGIALGVGINVITKDGNKPDGA